MASSMELDRLTIPCDHLAHGHRSGKVECVACGHRCKIGPDKRGICQLRFNDGQGLRVPWGYTAGVAVDPIEKKPFFHVSPGAGALSFGMLGCDLHCSFCQNWFTSQTLRDPSSSRRTQEVEAERLADLAVSRGCRAVISTYNEPLITAEWAREVFAAAKRRELLTGLVSNGFGTPEVIDYLQPVTDLFKVDLKAFKTDSYRRLGGRLEVVTETITRLVEKGFWVEIVTLLVPGFNDDLGELGEMARFIVGLSADIPWHVTAFHPDYQMRDRGPTSARSLAAVRQMGLDAGLHHVYAGNMPGALASAEDTFCPGCGAVLVRRRGFMVAECQLGSDGACPGCGTRVAGLW